jgi:hypothetical protein
MVKPTIQYLGFQTTDDRREYVLLSRCGTIIYRYTVSITHAAFASGQARFQDGPEISYLKLTKELELRGYEPVETSFTITDAELSEYRAAHTRPANRLTPHAARPGPPPSQ